MATTVAVPGMTNAKLLRIIETGKPSPEGLSKMRALAALRQSRSTRKAEVFSSILADRNESPRFKQMAVMGLLELGGRRAEQVLIENSQNVDEFTAPTVAQALGRIGSSRSAPLIAELEAAASPASKKRAAFAASLLAYRHNLDGHEVTVPSGRQLLSVDASAKTLPIEVSSARRSDVEIAMETLKREPLGINLTEEAAQRISCGPVEFLLVWNRDFAGRKLVKLQQRKGVAGVLFLKSRFEKAYSVSSLVLATPSRREVKLSLHKSSGKVMFAGSVSLEGGTNGEIDLRSVKQPGASAMDFSGKIEDGRLVIDGGRSAATVLERQVPKRSD